MPTLTTFEQTQQSIILTWDDLPESSTEKEKAWATQTRSVSVV